MHQASDGVAKPCDDVQSRGIRELLGGIGDRLHSIAGLPCAALESASAGNHCLNRVDGGDQFDLEAALILQIGGVVSTATGVGMLIFIHQ